MNLGKVLKDWRWANKMNLREAAKIFGIGAATLMRLEQGYNNPDGTTLAKILTWLMKSSYSDPQSGEKP